MRVVKSVYRGSSVYQNRMEGTVSFLLTDLESYTTQIIKGLHIPGASAKLRGTLRGAIGGLKNYEQDLFERLISFGRSLRILVDSSRGMNKEIVHRIEGPMKFLVQTYFHIAYQTKHKEITDTAQRLMKELADDPNEVSFLKGY